MTQVAQRIDAVLSDPVGVLQSSGATIGYVGFDIPDDILAAAPGDPCHLPWSLATAMPFVDKWMEESFSRATAGILQNWADGAYDFLDVVIFSRGDDSVQRLYYYVCELQARKEIAGPRPVMFDIAKVPRASSLERSIEAARRLCECLGVDEESLRRGVGKANRRRAIYGDISRLRTDNGALVERLSRAALFAPLESLIAPNDVGALFGSTPRGRVFLAGSSPPDDRLHRAVEACGWSISREIYDRSILRFGTKIEVDETDVFRRVGERAHASPFGPRAFASASRALMPDGRNLDIEAAVIWLAEEDEALAWIAPDYVEALKSLRIPTLVQPRRKWLAGAKDLEEITRFLEGLG